MSFFGDIPDAESRADLLFEVMGSKNLMRVVDDPQCCADSGHVGVADAPMLAEVFPQAYGDPFIKKSMLAVGLMVGEYRRAGAVCGEDLMAYADYQVPAVLRHLGILDYSPALAETDWFFWLQRKLPKKPFHLADATAY